MRRDDAVGVLEYTEQLTYLLFLKMAHERANRTLAPARILPGIYAWQRLLDASGMDLRVNLDLTWLKDDSLTDLDSLPSPDVIAREIVEDLTAALAEFEAVAAALEVQLGQSSSDLPEEGSVAS